MWIDSNRFGTDIPDDPLYIFHSIEEHNTLCCEPSSKETVTSSNFCNCLPLLSKQNTHASTNSMTKSRVALSSSEARLSVLRSPKIGVWYGLGGK